MAVNQESLVTTGLEVALRDGLFDGDRRIGLITNPTGATRAGVPTWKALRDAGCRVEALFGPEHGFQGKAQDAVQIGDESFDGIRVYSLYGKHVRPTREMLSDLDVLVYDIQDVGCRYYTYLYTLAYAMEEAANDLPVYVLDRPNPIDPRRVEGGPIDPNAESFVGGYGLPARYGMTVGEYSWYVATQYRIEVELTVVPMEGYRRDLPYRETGLPWTAPSPNLPSVEVAVVYPGTCLFEGTLLSEGRGTTRPFETIGAPWVEGERLREALTNLVIPGVTFLSTWFTPSFSKFAGETCQGVVLQFADHQAFSPLRTGILMISAIRQEFPDSFGWRPDWEGKGSFADRLAGGTYLREMIDDGASGQDVYDRACRGSQEFLDARAPHLLYR